ncbi:MAG: cation transporter [Nitrososphaerota archaeon]|nr:cation transporter [Nitrososphaerota archaeon]
MYSSESAREKTTQLVYKQISRGQLVAIISFFVNVGIGFFEVGFGLFFGSLALMADGVHSFVDAFVSLMIWLGIRYSQKKADGLFHYGYYKFDAIFSLFASVIMVASGLVISYIGLRVYFNPAVQHHVSINAVYIVLISIVTAIVLASLKQSYARKSGLVSLKTDALNSLKDGAASIVALVGILLASIGFYAFDSLAGLVIGVFVIVAGYFAIKQSSLVLADAYGNPQMVEEMKKIASSVPGVHAIEDLRVRRNGPFLSVEMRVKVDGNMSVFEADRISQEVVRSMRESIVSIGRVTVKPEPIQRNKL